MTLRRDPLAHPEPLIRRVYSYAAYRLGDGPDAQDVTSETFERALRGRAGYDASRGTPTAWLLGIARRVVADALARRETPVAELPDASDGSDLAEDSVRRLTLKEAIASLDEREQELIALRYGADLTARRIAQVLGLRTNAVEVALHRALARLRHQLDSPDAGSTAESDRSPLSGAK